jgi:hypothetical protein
MAASDYMDMLGDPVLATVQMLLDNDAILYFKMIVCPYTQPEVFSLHLRRMNMHSLSFPASTVTRFKYCIIKSLWSVLESMVRSIFPPSSLRVLQNVLHEEWCSIPLETVQNVDEAIPGRIQTITQKWRLNDI